MEVCICESHQFPSQPAQSTLDVQSAVSSCAPCSEAVWSAPDVPALSRCFTLRAKGGGFAGEVPQSVQYHFHHLQLQRFSLVLKRLWGSYSLV